MRYLIGTSLLFSFFLLLFVFIPRAEDAQNLEKLILASSGSKESILRSKQIRRGVIKEIWVKDKYARLEAPHSILYLLADEMDAIEELAPFKSSIYEKDRIREFIGERGRLYYKSRSLQGTMVNFSDPSAFSGIAKELRLFLKEGNLHVTASGIEADFKNNHFHT